MFKDVTINLTEPICPCEERNYQLFLCTGSINIVCGICNTKLSIPIKKLFYSVNINNTPNKPKKKINSNVSNVTPLFKKG